MKENKMNKENKTITNLYELYKNTPKKLKIICDWDEVIQACEPYAIWKYLFKGRERIGYPFIFKNQFKKFWKGEEFYKDIKIEYSSYSSKLNMDRAGKLLREKQPEIKNSPNFYQEAPFLTIAEDLLKLIKEDKIEKLIFLSTADNIKREVFRETFDKFAQFVPVGEILPGPDNLSRKSVLKKNIQLHLMSDYPEIRTKADWIKENASDFDIFIDDNPNICKSLVENKIETITWCEKCFEVRKKDRKNAVPCDSDCEKHKLTVLTPHYPAIENQHDERVLLVKNEVSDLKKEDFK